MSAIGLYIKELRVARGVTQEELSKMIDISSRQLIRIEKGLNNIKLSNLLKAVDVLKAPVKHIQQLIDIPTTSEEEIKSMVRACIDQKIINQIDELTDDIKDNGKIAEALSIIHQLESDPASLDRLVSYGHGLIDRKQ